MAFDVLMPKLGMTMEHGTVTEWLVQEGDLVERGDVLLTVETDKATLEVEALESGTLLKILVSAGNEVPVLTKIAVIGKAGEIITDEASDKAAALPKTVPAQMADAVLKPISPAATTASGAMSTPAAKRLAAELRIPIETVSPNVKGIITVTEVAAKAKTTRVSATPAARALAAESGVDIAVISNGKRLYKDDVVRAIPAAASERSAETIQMRPLQAAAGNALTRVWTTTPMVTNNVELDMSRAIELVDWLSSHANQPDVRVTVTDIAVKALAIAMHQNENANTYLIDGKLRKVDGIHIGVATATPRGLLVPVIRDVTKKSIMQICSEKNVLIKKARSGELGPQEMGNASTTFTNVGPFRAEVFSPIINYPESCIFGTGMIREKATVVDHQIVIRPMMWLNFTYDHRILDGEQAAKLLNTVRDILENPALFIGCEVMEK